MKKNNMTLLEHFRRYGKTDIIDRNMGWEFHTLPNENIMYGKVGRTHDKKPVII